MRRALWLLAGTALAVLVLLAAGGGLLARHGWSILTTPHQGFPGDEIFVEIPPGTSGGAILARLVAAGVLPESRFARLWLVHRMGDPPLHAGEYRFRGASRPLDVLAKLQRGEVALFRVTVLEGSTLVETAEALAAAGVAGLEELLAAFSRPGLVADLDPEATNLEGYLFPDTYHFPRRPGAEAVAAEMVGNFRRRFAADVAPLAEGAPPALRRLVTLASLVEKEARLDEERPLIAGVYANRLRIGMTLGADPTIIYGLKLEGRWDGNLRRHHLTEDAPYNSYRRPGLPPSPICSPGLGSLQAAMRPAETEALYFVSRNDGSHVFSRTLAEHSRAVDLWQRQYWRERWRREREAAAREEAGVRDN
ncbi:MAG TPA: endolytic transglycosylase MltG [Thermoanaerobaculia bacterium]|nr:endolytic transglycosylase MltG [Thermoanaerobaculia bacterium]